MKQLKGNITHYVYENSDNGYKIAKLILEDESEVVITGYFPKLAKEVTYNFTVSEKNHPKYGIQYVVEDFQKAETQNKEGLVAYLSSDLFTGIGPIRARKIVEMLGDQAIHKILEDKLILLDLGFNRLQVERLYQQLYDNQVIESTLVELYGYGLSSKVSMKLYTKYGADTLTILKKDPYQLILDIEGIGFNRADQIALSFGIAKDDARRIRAALNYGINQMIFSSGNTYLQKSDLTELETYYLSDIEQSKIKKVFDEMLSDSLIQIGTNFTVKPVYEAENKIAIETKRLMNKNIDTTVNTLEGLLERTEFELGIEYTIKQKEAIIQALSSPISIITGGPGTGKTTIINGITHIYAKLHDLNLEEDSITETIGLFAPTGRASRRMQSVIGIGSKTIHRALGYNYEGKFYYNETLKMPQKLIIIDEASMIDVFLMSTLLSAIPTDTQVIIVGDKDQLPSVGPGAILNDLIESNLIITITLDEIHRQAKNSGIIELARCVNRQIVSESDYISAEDIRYMNSMPNEILDVIIKTVSEAMNQGYDLYEDIQVLIPIYKGPLGIDHVNDALQKMLIDPNAKSITYGEKTYKIGDKVIQLVNSPEKEIMNGDIGIIKDISKVDNQDVVSISFQDHNIRYSKAELDDITHAYAISIHKSQGSEYKVVIMPLSRNYRGMLRKELLYTGITRTKTHLTLVGDLSLIEQASHVLNDKRKTLLVGFLSDSEAVSEVTPFDFM